MVVEVRRVDQSERARLLRGFTQVIPVGFQILVRCRVVFFSVLGYRQPIVNSPDVCTLGVAVRLPYGLEPARFLPVELGTDEEGVVLAAKRQQIVDAAGAQPLFEFENFFVLALAPAKFCCASAAAFSALRMR